MADIVKIPRKRTPGQTPEIRILNPNKGLNSLVSDSLIQDTEASDLLNIQFVESGCPSKAYGYTAVGTGLSNNPKGLGTFYTNTNRYVLTVDGTALKYLNSSTWTSISGATFTADKEVNFCQAGDNLFVWDGDQSACIVTTALSLSRLTTAPSAAFAIYYNGTQIAAGAATRPNRLYIADTTSANLGDFTNASGTLSTEPEVPGASAFAGTGAKFVDVNPGDGDKITGLAKFKNALVVFKERSIYQLTFDGSGNTVVTQITSNNGCVSHKSIDNVDNDVFYLTRNGYYVLGNEPNYFDSVRSNELSARINPTIQTITASNLSKVASIFSDFKFYSSIPSGGTTTNNKTLMYDKRYLSWSVTDHVHANAFCEFVDSNGSKHLYYAAADTNEVYEIGTSVYSADGDAIDAYWTSKAFDAGQFDIYKRWVDITLLFRQIQGTVDITIFTDNNTILKQTSISSTTSSSGSLGTSMLGSQILGGTGDTPDGNSTNNIPYRIKINTKSRTIKVKVSNGNNNETFTLLGFVISYVPYSRFSFPSAQKIY